MAVTIALAGLLAVVAAFLRRATAIQALNEDAFISFRYARNLLAGDGLVFNAGGERVEGITNLLWTLVLAAATRISGVPLPEVSVALGVACGAALLVVAFLWSAEELYRAEASPVALAVGPPVAALLVSLVPGLAFYSGSGLEVTFFCLLLTSGLYAVCRGGSVYSLAAGGFMLGLATATRPEGALVLGIASLPVLLYGDGVSLYQRVLRMLAVAVPGGVVVLAMTAFRLLYYGSVLPNTAYAKAGGMEVIERWGVPYLMNAVNGNFFVVGWLIVVCGFAVSRSFRPRSLAVIVITPLWAAYIVYAGGDYMPFHRLILPLVPAIFILAVPAFYHLASRMTVALPSPARIAVAATMAAALILPLAAGIPEVREREIAKHDDYIKDNQNRAEVAAWFRENDPQATIARNGVGVIGYYSDLRIIDMLGLNDEHIAKYGNKSATTLPGHQSSDAGYVISEKPDYIMVASTNAPFRFPGDRDLVESPRFQKEYELVRIELESGRDIRTFHRRDREDSLREIASMSAIRGG